MADKTITIRPGQTILVESIGGITVFIERLWDWVKPQHNGDATETLTWALSYLIGITDVEAIKIANARAKEHGQPTITVTQFREWLPTALSEVFAEWQESLK